MEQYLAMLRHILNNGVKREDRTGTGTIGVFGYQNRFDLSKGFPLLTTKKMYIRGIIHELLWFLRGETNIKYLVDNNVNIWNEWPFQAYLKTNNLAQQFPMYSESWNAELATFVEKIKTDAEFAKKWGELGPVYGRQWRNFEGVDQIKQLIEDLRKNPYSRRHIVTAWNPKDIPEMAKAGLPPCHCLFQFYVSEGKLSCQLYQRSADTFLGVPFNIASYALLTMIVAKLTNLEPGEFIHSFGDAHIYLNHVEQVQLQLTRSPMPLSKMIIKGNQKNVEDFVFEDFELIGYESHPAIKGRISV